VLEMTKRGEIHKCEICGNIIEVLHEGAGELVCCGQAMSLIPEKDRGTGEEKHKPVIKFTEEGIIVEVGSVPHVMNKDHYIMWIEAITENAIERKYLNPEDQPYATFKIKAKKVREYCNLHGLWITET